MAWSELAAFESSNLKSARYDVDTSTFEVTFKNGSTYQYFDIPQHVIDGFNSATSKGEFLAAKVKGHFRYSRI